MFVLADFLSDIGAAVAKDSPIAIALCFVGWLAYKFLMKEATNRVLVEKLRLEAERAKADSIALMGDKCHAHQTQMQERQDEMTKMMSEAMFAASKSFGANSQVLESTSNMLRDTARLLVRFENKIEKIAS